MYSRVNSQLLEDRLDAEFYSLEQIRNHEILQYYGVRPLSAFCNGINVGYTGELTSVYVNKGTTLYRVSDISGVFLSNDDVNFVPDDFASSNPQIWIRDNDIVFAAVGNTIGKVALKTTSMPDGVCSRALMIARPIEEKVDSSFLIAYLATKFAQKALLRGVSGSAQPVLNTPLIANLPVISAESVTQKYIGDKVRQAEQLRAWAKYVQQQAAVLLPAYINEIQRHEAKSYRAKDIIPERLDSLFYHPDYIALEGKMKAKGCKRLGLITKQIKDLWDKKKAEAFEYYEIGGLDITTGQVSSTKTHTVGAPSRAKTKVQQGDVLVSTVRPNRKNVGFIVDSVTDSEMVATSGFSVLRFSSLAQAAFYHAWLRTDDATAQLMRWNSGSAYPAIDDDVPLNIIIPDFEQTFVDSWGQKLLDAQFAYVYARRLTEAAKTLVEALIEGQLTEQQLIQAQQALDDGDNSLDQAILSKLSHEGYAIEGATPLFSDIDELYRLLASAAQTEAEE